MLAMLHPEPLQGDVFNVGTGHRSDLNQLVAHLNSIYGRNLEPVYELERAGDVKDSLASLTKIQKVLGYWPTVNFEEGLRRTVEAETSSN